MATLHPALLSIHPTSLGSYRERDVLAMLEQGLPEGFDVFHSIDWSVMHEGRQTFGEVDVVVMGGTYLNRSRPVRKNPTAKSWE